MRCQKITIGNRLGLHARASAKLVSLASEFDAEITLQRNGQSVNAKSIMGIMMLAAAGAPRSSCAPTGATKNRPSRRSASSFTTASARRNNMKPCSLSLARLEVRMQPYSLRSSPIGQRRGPQARDGLFADFVLI